MRSTPLAWTAAGMAALAVTAALVIAFGGGGGEPADPPAAAPAATSLPDAAPADTLTESATTPPTPQSTTTVAVATTTSTTPATTTTTVTPASTPAGYVFVPKPAAGPNTIAPGGALTKHLAEDIAAAFGLGIGAVEAGIAAAELPPEAGGNPEGWLAPGTYPPVDDAGELVQAMVDRRVAQLEARTVPRDDWHRVVTAASVIEKETYNQNEKPGVARVLTNRLAGGGPLQMDSIILYPVPEDRIFTTSEERASNQPYNSYRHDGLPPTPICSPDEASLDAFLDPPPGDWWFYVTVDLDSGETRYAVTYDDHQSNVELLRAWLRSNPTP